MEILVPLLYSVLAAAFIGFMTFSGMIIYRVRGMGEDEKSKIVRFYDDAIPNLVFVSPLVLICYLASGSWLFSLPMFIVLWYAVTQIGHGTVFFDNKKEHAPVRERGGKIVSYGENGYQPWYIRLFNPLGSPAIFPWDVRAGITVTALWVTVPVSLFLVAFGAFIPAALVLLSSLAKPIAYWIGWNITNGGTETGEYGYGLGSVFVWSIVIVGMFIGYI